MGLTLVEKIAARHADGLAPGTVVRSGDFISIRPRHVMTHDNTGAVIPKFKQIGATTIADPAQPSNLDAEDPAAASVFCYLVRARNGCPSGNGTIGARSSGQARTGRTCP